MLTPNLCRGGALAALLLSLLLLAPAAAAQIPKGDLLIELELIASGLTAPVGVTHAGDGSGRLFILEQWGRS